MKGMVPNTLAIFFGLFLTSVNAWPALAQETPEAKRRPQAAEIRIGHVAIALTAAGRRAADAFVALVAAVGATLRAAAL